MDIFSKPRDFIYETANPLELKKPFPVAWLNGYNGLVPQENYPEHDVQLRLIDREEK